MEQGDKTAEKRNSEAKSRITIQKLLEKNMRQANGMFHCKELNERSFVNDLFKNFDLTPKQNT